MKYLGTFYEHKKSDGTPLILGRLGSISIALYRDIELPGKTIKQWCCVAREIDVDGPRYTAVILNGGCILYILTMEKRRKEART